MSRGTRRVILPAEHSGGVSSEELGLRGSPLAVLPPLCPFFTLDSVGLTTACDSGIRSHVTPY